MNPQEIFEDGEACAGIKRSGERFSERREACPLWPHFPNPQRWICICVR
jgi:hypothetical protein